MPIFDFFRNFFGRGSPDQEPSQNRINDEQRHRNSFRNPIWQTDEDDDDDVNDFGNHHQFRIFSDPFEMTRFFETQMDELLKNFFGGFNGFGNDSNVFFGNALPGPSSPEGNPIGPRDEVLKPSHDEPSSHFKFDFNNILPMPADEPLDDVLKPSYELPDGQKQDSDIDGKLKSNELAKIWKNPAQDVQPSKPQFSFRSFGKSVSTQFVRRPDGSLEQRRTVRDSDGNEETTVTRQIGDKVHTVVTKKAKDGSEIKSEDIVNMDENELQGFDEKWTKIQTPKKDSADDFPWHKFFGPNPKL
ncbi:HCLS1-associated protein X-1 isoform X2 [Copidosoma floridanum]|uniref:HCLS1-associated protein X-1 isoform X2 n=1 Tax=Copidosoma floridanum TaxID=29053 RepID=UPI0006C9C02D|nr:HCLS1-associated protein X-1 isoform X2 [Copidosoma floridanum]